MVRRPGKLVDSRIAVTAPQRASNSALAIAGVSLLVLAYVAASWVISHAQKEKCSGVPLSVLQGCTLGVVFVVHILPNVLTIIYRRLIGRAWVYVGLFLHLALLGWCWYYVATKTTACVKNAIHVWSSLVLATVVYSLLIPFLVVHYSWVYSELDRERKAHSKKDETVGFVSASSGP